ncbi:TonB-dependent receptor [Rheinheimera sp.]|uniref:TonB-dependent receptor n=1 Tax=Rheinheimera sp. TaxID=1869214 RepID=UPI00307CC850
MKKTNWFQRNALSAAIAASVFGGLAAPVYAQIEGATLSGQILNAGAEGVQVTATDTERGYVKTTQTRADGSYIFVGLKPGTYQITVANQSTDPVELRLGQRATIDISLPAASAENVERIEVKGVRIESFSGGEVGTNITPEMIARLPQNNRNFLAFADLAPGVQLNTDGAGNVSLRGGAQASRNVNVFLDGVSQKDYVLKGGVTGQDSSRGNPFPQNAIGEYKVITQNYKAEFDQVGSTAITAVTRSGTNSFEGDFFVDYTNEGLREAEPNEQNGKTASMTRHAGLMLAGPIVLDELHFLLSYERKTIDEPVDIPGGDGANLVTLPAEYAALLGRETSGFEEDLLFTKLDWAINQDHALEFSAKLRDESDVSNFGGANTLSYGSNRKVRDHRYNLKHLAYLEHGQNEFRLTYEDASWNPQPYTDGPGMVLQTANRQAILNMGGGRDFQDKGQKGWSVQNDHSWLDLEWHGNHVIKAGVKFKQVRLNTLERQPYNPQYFYNVQLNGNDNFNTSIPYMVQWGVPVTGSVGGAVEAKNRQLGLFLQDDWEVTDRLTLNPGIRWDYEETPGYKNYQTPADLAATLRGWSNLDNANYDINDYISTGSERSYFKGAWQPRFGFSYVLGDSRDHSLFGGYGRSYDRNQFDFIQLEQSKGSFTQVSYLFSGDPANPCAPSSGNCIAWDPQYLTQAGLDSLLSSVSLKGERFLLSNDLKMPYSDQFSLGVRSNWGDWNTEVSVARTESKDGFNWLLGNRRPDGSFLAPGTSWGQPWGFGVPGWGNLILSSNDGQTRNNNIFVKIDRPHHDFWGLNLAYTFSDAEENRVYNEVFALDYESVADYGFKKSVGVPDHRVVLTGTYDLPWEIFASFKYTWASATTYEYLDCRQGGTACFFARTEPNQSDYQRFDLSLSKEFASGSLVAGSKFRVRFDVQNLFNQDNFNNFNLNPDSADFTQPNPFNATNGGRRQLKLSAGWSF